MGVAVHALVLESQHCLQIELRFHLDAHLGEAVAGLLVELGGMQQGLRWNAADIQASAAMGGAFLHHRNLEPQLRRANGADIAAGARTDHNQVVLAHPKSLSLS